jgi:hypothetical protein
MARVTRHLGFCAICERDIKVQDNLLVHHGYKRPGIGEIVGDCFGVYKPPYELSFGPPQEYAASVENWLRIVERQLASFPPARLPFREQRKDEHGHWNHVDVLKSRGEVAKHDWAYAERQGRRELEAEHAALQRELARLQAWVESWQPAPLRTVEEEQEQLAARKAASVLERHAKRSAKLADMVQRYQGRLDSAVRQKKIATVMDIFRSAWSKLPDASGTNALTRRSNITGEDAILLLDRDALWRELGVMDAAGHVLRPREDWRAASDWETQIERQAEARGWKRRY